MVLGAMSAKGFHNVQNCQLLVKKQIFKQEKRIFAFCRGTKYFVKNRYR